MTPAHYTRRAMQLAKQIEAVGRRRPAGQLVLGADLEEVLQLQRELDQVLARLAGLS